MSVTRGRNLECLEQNLTPTRNTIAYKNDKRAYNSCTAFWQAKVMAPGRARGVSQLFVWSINPHSKCRVTGTHSHQRRASVWSHGHSSSSKSSALPRTSWELARQWVPAPLTQPLHHGRLLCVLGLACRKAVWRTTAPIATSKPKGIPATWGLESSTWTQGMY